jgi:hypothetical protein
MGLGLLGGEPHRSAPHALGTKGEGGGDLAPAADATRGEHGRRCDRVHDLGDEHHGGDLARVAARLVTLGHDDVDAGRLLALGVLALTDERRDRDVLTVGLFHHEVGRGTEGVGHQTEAGSGEAHVEQRLGSVM